MGEPCIGNMALWGAIKVGSSGLERSLHALLPFLHATAVTVPSCDGTVRYMWRGGAVRVGVSLFVSKGGRVGVAGLVLDGFTRLVKRVGS